MMMFLRMYQNEVRVSVRVSVRPITQNAITTRVTTVFDDSGKICVIGRCVNAATSHTRQRNV